MKCSAVGGRGRQEVHDHCSKTQSRSKIHIEQSGGARCACVCVNIENKVRQKLASKRWQKVHAPGGALLKLFSIHQNSMMNSVRGKHAGHLAATYNRMITTLILVIPMNAQDTLVHSCQHIYVKHELKYNKYSCRFYA